MKKVKKIVLATVAANGVFLPTSISAHASVDVKEYQAAEITPRKDIIEWRFKLIDGHWYKRLWNASKAKWLTDWIKI